MTDPITTARRAFDAAIAEATTADAGFAALHVLTSALAPARLFTVTLTDMAAGVARRTYSSDHAAYGVSGTKPISPDRWFNRIHIERLTYVENDIANDLEHFTDYDLIRSLGCEAVVNLPVVLRGDLAGTVNILDAKGSYPTEIVAQLEDGLRGPAMLAFALASTQT